MTAEYYRTADGSRWNLDDDGDVAFAGDDNLYLTREDLEFMLQVMDKSNDD